METREVITEVYDRYSRGDLARTLELVDDNICYRWVAHGDHAQFSGTCDCRDTMMARLEELLGVWQPEKFEPTDLLVDGDRAASRVRIRYHARANGNVLESELAHFWTVRDGKVTELVEFYDTAHAEALAG